MIEACSVCNMTFGTAEKRVRRGEFQAHTHCIPRGARSAQREVRVMITRLGRVYFFPWLEGISVELAKDARGVFWALQRLYLRLSEDSVDYGELDEELVKLQEITERNLLKSLAGPKAVHRDARKIRRRVKQAQIKQLLQYPLQ